MFLPAGGIALFDPEELIDEAASFPNAAHDDMVDAVSQALAEMLLDGTGAQAWLEWARRKAETVTFPAASRELPGAYRKCGKPDCIRRVSLASVYCCTPCSVAADGRYEIHAHSPECDQRAAERGPADATERADAEFAAPVIPLDPMAARKAVRDAMWRAQRS